MSVFSLRQVARLCRYGALCAFALALVSCASVKPQMPAEIVPHFAGDRFIAEDGAALGLKTWDAPGSKAVVVALHGMNDYSATFRYFGPALAEAGVTVYAYDQRGFGRSPGFGRWPGDTALKNDLRAAIAAAHKARPGLPLIVVGHSMGGAVVLAAMRDGPLDADGVILGAPGVWGGAQMPLFYRVVLRLAAAVTPRKTLTGKSAGRQATDNIPLLRSMIADPLIIKDTRIDSIRGLVQLMGEGYRASATVGGKILIQTGERDELVPLRAQKATAARLCGDVSFKLYPEGWHLIFGDLRRADVFADDIAFVDDVTRRAAAGPAVSVGPAAGYCGAARGRRDFRPQ